MANWTATAEVLDAQGETVLASEVRDFVRCLPRVLTDKERMAVQYIELQSASKSKPTEHDEQMIRTYEHGQTR